MVIDIGLLLIFFVVDLCKIESVVDFDFLFVELVDFG